MWGSNLTANISVNGTGTTDSLYFQSPLSDATEYTETSFRSTDAFGGGAGFRPTINSYQYANAQAISKIATLAGDSANATTFASKATALKAAVQHALWDPQRQFFFHVYNNDSTNSGIAGTRTTWREAMGFAPWAFELPDASYSTAWQYLTDPQRFAGADGPYTLERIHRLRGRAGRAGRRHGQHGGDRLERPVCRDHRHRTAPSRSRSTPPAPARTPVDVFYANTTGATATQTLVVNGASGSTTVTYPATSTSATFAASQVVTVNVPCRPAPTR